MMRIIQGIIYLFGGIPIAILVYALMLGVLWFRNSLYSIGFSIPFANESFMMLALNLVLFVPWGFLLSVVIRRKKWNWIKILLTGLVLSITIEFLQMFGGRMSELDDVIMNSLGTLLGYWMFKICECIRKNKFSVENEVT